VVLTRDIRAGRRTLIRGDRFSLIAGFSQCTGYQLHLDSRYPDFRRGQLAVIAGADGAIRGARRPSDVKGAVPRPRGHGTAPLAPLSGMPASAPGAGPAT